jgi:hypothetical protein
LVVVVLGGFFVKLAGAPHLFQRTRSTGLQNSDQGPKKSFSTESADLM